MRRVLTAAALALVTSAPAQAAATPAPPAAGRYFQVRTETVAVRLRAYARVEPIARLPVRTTEAGEILDLHLLPGSRVHAGEMLARLGGPQIDAQLARAAGARRSAEAQLAAARKALAQQRALYRLRLGTQPAVADAESALARAQAALDAAVPADRAARSLSVLRAPADGTLLAWNAADGEHVAAGRTVLTLQTDHLLWLKAFYYGTDAIAVRPGLRGRFLAATDSTPVPVEVVSVFPSLAADGGEAVGLRATGGAHWRGGEFGRVTLDGPAQRVSPVPTRALILDRGHWWVMLHTPQGDRPQAVVPGAVRGWDTLIRSGLAPGDRILVNGAYLEFHRGIAASYQPPD